MFRCELSGEATTGGGAPTFPLSLLFDVCSKIRSQFCKTLRQFSKQVSGNLGAPCPSWTQYKIDGAICMRIIVPSLKEGSSSLRRRRTSCISLSSSSYYFSSLHLLPLFPLSFGRSYLLHAGNAGTRWSSRSSWSRSPSATTTAPSS